MANRYAEMDAEDTKKAPPSKKPNRYAEMDAKPKPAKKSTRGNLPRDYSWREVPGAAWGNVKQDAADFVGVLGKAYHDPAAAAERAYQANEGVKGAVGALGNYVVNNPVQSAKNVGNTLLGVPAAVGDYLGTNYGDEGSIKRSLAEHPYRSGLDIASAATLPGAAQAGRAAATAVAARVPTGVTRAAQAARYAAVPTHAINDATNAVATRAIPAVGRAIENATHPTNAMMLRAAEGRGPQVVRELRTAAPIVPGSVPSTVQAVSGAEAPGISAIAKAAEDARPAQQLARNLEQNRARTGYLGTIGHADNDLPSAIADEAVQSTRNYAYASGGLAPVDARLRQLATSPSMQDAYQLAHAIAAERRVPFPSRPGAFSGDDVHLMKEALDDLAFDGTLAARHGIGRTHSTAIQGTRADFIRWAEGHIPEYRVARETKRDLSQPIDQTLVRQELQRGLNPLGDRTIHQNGGTFANATRDAATSNPAMFRATGQRRYDNLDDLFTPQQMGVVGDVNRDLSRVTSAEQQAALGVGEFGDDINRQMTEALGFRPTNAAANAGLSMFNRRLAEGAIDEFQTPEGAAALMENALMREATVGRYSRGYDAVRNFLTYGNPARWGNRYPTLINAMGAQQEQPTR